MDGDGSAEHPIVEKPSLDEDYAEALAASLEQKVLLSMDEQDAPVPMHSAEAQQKPAPKARRGQWPPHVQERILAAPEPEQPQPLPSEKQKMEDRVKYLGQRLRTLLMGGDSMLTQEAIRLREELKAAKEIMQLLEETTPMAKTVVVAANETKTIIVRQDLQNYPILENLKTGEKVGATKLLAHMLEVSSYCQLHVQKGLSNTEVTEEYQRILQASLIKYPHFQKRVQDLAPQAEETIKAYQKRCIISMGTEYYPELMFRMRHLRQTDKQSLFEYHHEVELIIDLLDEPVDSPYHILSFIIGLREVPVRNKVTKQHYERKFPTLEAALQKAQKVSQSEDAQKWNSKSNKRNRSADEQDDETKDNESDVESEKEAKKPVNKKGKKTSSGEPAVCQLCGIKGHKANTCRKKPKANSNNATGTKAGGGQGGNKTAPCKHCGYLGHVDDACFTLEKNKSKRPAGFDLGNLPDSFVDERSTTRVDVISRACRPSVFDEKHTQNIHNDSETDALFVLATHLQQPNSRKKTKREQTEEEEKKPEPLNILMNVKNTIQSVVLDSGCVSCSIITKNKANELSKIEFETYDTATLIAWDGSISKPIGRTVPTHVSSGLHMII